MLGSLLSSQDLIFTRKNALDPIDILIIQLSTFSGRNYYVWNLELGFGCRKIGQAGDELCKAQHLLGSVLLDRN